MEQALQAPWIQTIEVTPEMLEEQREKIKQAKKSVKWPNWKLRKKWGRMSYSFIRKRFMYYPKKGSIGPGIGGENLERANDWLIDNYPDYYAEVCLECLELGLKPYRGLIFNVIRF
ncbi:MAG: hypothetical protein J6Y82_04220 [Bacteroidales bacterium]|nr:hypothetical protein [Bacteroidales bacterium]